MRSGACGARGAHGDPCADAIVEIFQFLRRPPLPAGGRRTIHAVGLSLFVAYRSGTRGRHARLSAAGVPFHCAKGVPEPVQGGLQARPRRQHISSWGRPAGPLMPR